MHEGLFRPHSHIQPGACCHCQRDVTEVGGLVNLVFLKRRAPVAGTGWGCCICGIPEDGAIAILCNECFQAGKPILFVCEGLVLENKRTPIESLSEIVFDHNVHNHPEYFKNDDVELMDEKILAAVYPLLDGMRKRGLDKNWRWN
jgi:hypothetical protein